MLGKSFAFQSVFSGRGPGASDGMCMGIPFAAGRLGWLPSITAGRDVPASSITVLLQACTRRLEVVGISELTFS